MNLVTHVSNTVWPARAGVAEHTRWRKDLGTHSAVVFCTFTGAPYTAQIPKALFTFFLFVLFPCNAVYWMISSTRTLQKAPL